MRLFSRSSDSEARRRHRAAALVCAFVLVVAAAGLLANTSLAGTRSSEDASLEGALIHPVRLETCAVMDADNAPNDLTYILSFDLITAEPVMGVRSLGEKSPVTITSFESRAEGAEGLAALYRTSCVCRYSIQQDPRFPALRQFAYDAVSFLDELGVIELRMASGEARAFQVVPTYDVWQDAEDDLFGASGDNTLHRVRLDAVQDGQAKPAD